MGCDFLRILICDDDRSVVEQLQKYIIEFFKHGKLKTPEIKSYSNGENLLSDVGSKDIVFLDVEMPGLNGIYVGRELKNKNKNTIIFIITSYVEYLDDAMRFHVFRYLSKPLDKQRLFQNMKDAIQLYNSTNILIPLETREGVYTCTASEIIYVETVGRTITIYTIERDFTVRQNIEYWKNTLNLPCFFNPTVVLSLTWNMLQILTTPLFISIIISIPPTLQNENTLNLRMPIFHTWKAWGNRLIIKLSFIFLICSVELLQAD